MTNELSDEETAVLTVIPFGGIEVKDIHAPGVSAQKRRHVIARLARRGLIQQVANPWGDEVPTWFERCVTPPDGYVANLEIEKGMIFDYYEPNGRPLIWLELTGEINEYGCAEGHLTEGQHPARKVYVTLYELEKGDVWRQRYRGGVTAWSAKFACPVHGECTEEMVSTKKTCRICDTGLLRF